jgi:hypothetical protein
LTDGHDVQNTKLEAKAGRYTDAYLKTAGTAAPKIAADAHRSQQDVSRLRATDGSGGEKRSHPKNLTGQSCAVQLTSVFQVSRGRRAGPFA